MPIRLTGQLFLMVAAVGCALLAAIVSGAPNDKPLFSAGGQSQWKIDEAKGEAIYLPDKKTLDTPTIILSRAALGDSSITISIDSDARLVRVTDEQDKMEFDLAGAKNRECFLSSKDSTVYFDGKESANKGIWQTMLARDGKELLIQFVGANFVTLHFRTGTQAPVSPPAVHATPEVKPIVLQTDNPKSSQPLSAMASPSDKVKLWQRAIFRLNTKDAAKNVSGNGTGFLVSHDGFAITNFHVIQGASGGSAQFEGITKELPVELWAALPLYDLALVKVQFAKPEDVPEPLHISDGTSGAGEEVYAIGFPEFGFTVTRGIVSGVRRFDKLPSSAQKSFKYATDSQWIQTDCTINHGNSGGPLIAAAGEVIGINTWYAARDDNNEELRNAYFALDISQARKLIASRPDKPLTYAVALQKYANTEQVAAGFPSITVVRNIPASEITDRMGALGSTIACPKCKGTGTVLVTTQTGTRRNGSMIYPVTETKPETCPACSGSTYNAVAFAAQAAKVVDTIARLDPNDKNYHKQLDDTCRRIWVISEKYPLAFLQLNLAADWGTKRAKNPRGLPLMLVGKFLTTLDDGTDDPLTVVKCRDMLYVLNNTVTAHATKGDDVVFGGLLAGSLAMKDGAIVPVLQYGFIISDDAK